jgi:hypothetical protein
MRPFVGTSVGGAVYRKYLDEGSSSSHKQKGQKTDKATQPDGEVHHFIDTGNTYEPAIQQPEVRKVQPPSLANGGSGVLVAGGVLGAGLALVTLDNPLSFAFLAGTGAALASAAVAAHRIYYNQKAQQQLKTLKAQIEEASPIDELQKQLQQYQLPDKQREWRNLWLYVGLISAYIKGTIDLSAASLTQLEEHLQLDPDKQQQVKKAVFADVLNQMLEDHLIAEEEERDLQAIQEVLGLSDAAIEQERQTIRAMAQLREAKAKSPEPVEADVHLKQGEVCYYSTEGRIVKEKIVNRYQADNQVHKEIGYDTDMEGDLYLTDRRILLVSDGAREYRLNTILDVTLSLEDNTVQLTIEDRKTPVILTMPNAPLFAAKLEQLLEPEAAEE